MSHIFLFCVWIYMAKASGDFQVSMQKYAWHEAKSQESFAVPAINVATDPFTVEIDPDIVNEDMWIGYFQMTTAFEYKGCVTTGKQKIHKMIPKELNSPGLCYTFCSKLSVNIIGISQDKCYCLVIEPIRNFLQPHCNASCKGEGLACGGDTFMSVYKIKDISATGNKKNCLAFQNNEWSGWESCNNVYRIICMQGEMVDSIAQNGNYSSWIGAANTCFKRNRSQVSYEHFKKSNITGASSQTWTNVIKSRVVYTFKDYDRLSSNKDFKFGYVKRKGNEIEFKFESDGTKKKAILTSKYLPESSNNYGNDDKSNDVGGIVGATVTSILVLIAVAVILVILKRRNMIPLFCKRKPTTEGQYQTGTSFNGGLNTNNDISTSEDHTYNVIELTSKPNVKNQTNSPFNENHSFDNFGLEQNNGTSNNVDAGYAHTYFVLEQTVDSPLTDSTYNIANAPGRKKIANSNVYNKLDMNSRSAYDYTQNKPMNRNNPTEDPYDTTNAGTKPKSGTRFSNTDESTYNQINGTQLEKNNTDNEYGMPNPMKHSSVAREDNQDNEEDTYNRINETIP